MSDPLIGAFQENREHGQGCASPEEIWRAVAGLEGQDRTAVLVDHSIGCGDCARLWRLARQAQAESAPTPVVPIPHAANRRRWAVVAGASLAAAAALLFLVHRPPAENTLRGPAEEGITSKTGPELPRDAFLLRWTPQGPAATYRIQVTLPDLTEVDSADALTTPERLVPAPALERVPSGSEILWRVEAKRADGRSVTSPPFQTRVK